MLGITIYCVAYIFVCRVIYLKAKVLLIFNVTVVYTYTCIYSVLELNRTGNFFSLIIECGMCFCANISFVHFTSLVMF